MKNRAYFLREDLDTYKPKFKLLCAEIKTEKIVPVKVAPLEIKSYISRINIIEKK